MAKVYAYRIDGKLQVSPSPVIVNDGDKLDLENLTDDEIDWRFPQGPFGSQVNKKTDGKGSKEKTPKAADHSAPQAYKYRVQKVTALRPGAKRRKRAKVMDDDDFADPVIIIET